MALTVAELVALLREIEEEDPLDFGPLPISEEDARTLIAQHLVGLAAQLEASLADAPTAALHKEAVLLAVAGHCLLENFALHARQLLAGGARAHAQADRLLRRLSANPPRPKRG